MSSQKRVKRVGTDDLTKKYSHERPAPSSKRPQERKVRKVLSSAELAKDDGVNKGGLSAEAFMAKTIFGLDLDEEKKEMQQELNVEEKKKIRQVFLDTYNGRCDQIDKVVYFALSDYIDGLRANSFLDGVNPDTSGTFQMDCEFLLMKKKLDKDISNMLGEILSHFHVKLENIFNNMIGMLLTFIDSMEFNDARAKAVKDMVKKICRDKQEEMKESVARKVKENWAENHINILRDSNDRDWRDNEWMFIKEER